MKRIFISFTLAFILCFAQTAKAEVYELSFAHTAPQTHDLHKYTLKLAEELKEKSNGRIQLNIFDNSSLVKSEGMPAAVRDGGCDIGVVTPPYVPADAPLNASFTQPFLVENAYEGTKLWSAMRTKYPEMQAELDEIGITLGAYVAARSVLGSLNNPIHSIADIKGKRVLVWTPTAVDEVKSWGGIPVMIGISDTYIALQRGMGEIIYCSIPMMVAAKYTELVKYATFIPSQMSNITIMMNRSAYTSLPKDLQQIIDEATGYEKTSLYMGKGTQESENNSILVIEKAGITTHELSSEALEEFRTVSRTALQPYWVNLLGKNKIPDPEAWLNKIYTFRDNYQPE